MKKIFALAILVVSLAVSGVASANGPTPGPVPGPGCFGLWRAGSVQLINESGLGPAGKNFFAERAGDNSTINAENRAECTTP